MYLKEIDEWQPVGFAHQKSFFEWATCWRGLHGLHFLEQVHLRYEDKNQ